MLVRQHVHCSVSSVGARLAQPMQTLERAPIQWVARTELAKHLSVVLAEMLATPHLWEPRSSLKTELNC